MKMSCGTCVNKTLCYHVCHINLKHLVFYSLLLLPSSVFTRETAAQNPQTKPTVRETRAQPIIARQPQPNCLFCDLI